MSTNIEYLIQLHRNGVITDGDLRKGIRMLKEPSETPTEVPSPSPKTAVPSPSTENKRAKRRKKKKARRLRQKEQQARQKHEQWHKAVMDELKQVYSQREKKSKLKLVDRPLCDYFKTYEIDARTYKDPSALFSDKKSMITKQINQDIKEYNGIKFSVGLSYRVLP